MADNTTLTTFFENWKLYQDGIVAAIAPLDAAQLALRAAPNLRTLDELGRHMIGARARWFNFVLDEGGPEIAPLTRIDWDAAPPVDAATITAGLATTWQLMMDAVARWSPADLQQVISKQNSQGETFVHSRNWVLWHLLEHDLHHGGEISLTLGMHGLPAPDM